MSTKQVQVRGIGPQAQEALHKLGDLVVDGMRHGFFGLELTCEITQGGRRQLKIKAGKSYQFTIPEDELPR